MKIPETIKIGGVTYVITLDSELREKEQCHGKVNFGKARISIDAGLDPSIIKSTLVHEIIEVINEENEYGLPHRTIQSLATQIYQVIVDNPEVFKNDE